MNARLKSETYFVRGDLLKRRIVGERQWGDEDEWREETYWDEKPKEEGLANLEELQREQWFFEESGIPSKFHEATFDSFERQCQPSAFQACLRYAQDADREGSGLLLSGPPGVGKTHLEIAILQHEMERRNPLHIRGDGEVLLRACPVYYVGWGQLLGRIRASYGNSGEDEGAILGKLAEVELLGLDDFGKYQPANPDFMRRIAFEVINTRYEAQMPLILTTNLTLPELGLYLGQAVADRLLEICELVQLEGDSYRPKVRARCQR
jgi:DNA replication protein DnaC